MSVTIKTMSIKCKEIDQNIQRAVPNLKMSAQSFLLIPCIRLKFTTSTQNFFNTCTYKTIRTKNTFLINQNRDPNSNSKPLEQRYNVVIIPEDLPLSEHEKSILGKGLNFMPFAIKANEFNVEEETKIFSAMSGKLKTHFHDKEESSDQLSRDKFQSLKPKKSNWTSRPLCQKMPCRHLKT